MHILHINTEKSWRGGEQQLAYLVEESLGQGVKTTVAGRKGSRLEDYCTRKNVPYYSLKANKLRYAAGFELARFLRKSDVDLVHAHASNAHSIANVAKRWGAGQTLIASKRTNFPIKRPAKYLWPDRVICISRLIQQQVQAAVPRQQVDLVYSGIDPVRFAVPQDDLKRELGLTHQTLVGNCSALSAEKDYPTFLNTARLLCDKHPGKFRFVIIGTGPQEAEIKQHAARLKLENEVHFLGFMSDLNRKLSSLDVLLMPSRVEGLGTSILDAMWCKVPVVSTRAGGIPELIEERQTGLLAEVGDAENLSRAICHIIDHPEQRKEMIHKAHQQVATRFTKQQMALATLDIYRQSLQGNSPVRSAA